MKTKMFVKFAAIIAVFAALWAAPSVSKAQAGCPYTIDNQLGCTIDITYTIFCNAGGWFTNTVTVPPFSQYTIPCSDFPTVCRGEANIEFNLLRVDGVDFICDPSYSNTVAATIPSADASGLFPGVPCNSIFMDWYGAPANILKIHP